MGQIWINEELYGSNESIDIHYNNSSSKIEATNIQAAIDELVQKGGGSSISFSTMTKKEFDALEIKPTEGYIGIINNNSDFILTDIYYMPNYTTETGYEYLFKNGKLNNFNTITYPDYTKKEIVDNNLIFYSTYGAYYAGSLIWGPIDITNTKKIITTILSTTVPGDREKYIGISKTNEITSSSVGEKKTQYISSASPQTVELDVSEYSGEYYFFISAGSTDGTKTVTISEIKYDIGINQVESSGAISNYSLEEQIIGKWIDGSDIYQKTYCPITSNVLEEDFSNKELIEASGCMNYITNNKIIIGSPYGYVYKSSANKLVIENQNTDFDFNYPYNNITIKYIYI